MPEVWKLMCKMLHLISELYTSAPEMQGDERIESETTTNTTLSIFFKDFIKISVNREWKKSMCGQKIPKKENSFL